jgi:hypothetical protein
MYLKSQFIAKADEPRGKNSNIYSLDVLQKIIIDFNFMEEDSMLGEFSLEESEWIKTQINLSKVSHLVKDLYLSDKNELLADIKILNTPSGLELEKNLDKVYFTLNGLGSLQANKLGFYTVLDNYKLISITANLDDNLKFKNTWRRIDEDWNTSIFN